LSTYGEAPTSTTSALISIGNFIDQDLEEELFQLENKYRGYFEIMSEIQANFKARCTKNNNLANRYEFIKFNLKFFVQKDNLQHNYFSKFRDHKQIDQMLKELDRTLLEISDVVYFFNRKRGFYDRYKEFRLKSFEQESGINKNTISNPKAMLAQLETAIHSYNKKLHEFLTKNQMVGQLLEKCVAITRSMNEMLSH